MRNLKGRLAAVEQRLNPPEPKPWHWIICEDNETAEDATARYDREQGPIGDDNCIIWRPIAASERRSERCPA